MGGWWSTASCLRIIFEGSFLRLFLVWSRKIFKYFFKIILIEILGFFPTCSPWWPQFIGKILEEKFDNILPNALSLAWKVLWALDPEVLEEYHGGRNRMCFPYVSFWVQSERLLDWFALIHYSLFSPLVSADYCLTVSKIFVPGVIIGYDSWYVPFFFDNV